VVAGCLGHTPKLEALMGLVTKVSPGEGMFGYLGLGRVAMAASMRGAQSLLALVP